MIRNPLQEGRNAATMVVYEWQRNGIPEPGSGVRRSVSTTIDVETIIETIRKAKLTPGDTERVAEALKDRGLIEIAVVKAGPGSERFAVFLARFWDYDESPYVWEKLAHGHRIGRRHCYNMTLWFKLYWPAILRR